MKMVYMWGLHIMSLLFLRKILISCAVVFLGFTSCMAVELVDLHARRDALIAQRNKISSEEDCPVLEQYYSELSQLLSRAVGKRRKERLLAHLNDKTYFANTGINISELVYKEVEKLVQENSAYTFTADEIGICDSIMCLDQAEVDVLANSMIVITGMEPPVAMFLKQGLNSLSADASSPDIQEASKAMLQVWQKHFPDKAYLLVFLSFDFETLQDLYAILPHELAHLTQMTQKNALTGYDLARWMEIDADIKAICVRNTQGEWCLSENHEQVISGIYNMSNEIFKIQTQAIDALCDGLQDDELKRVRCELNQLNLLDNHDLHPIPESRRQIMSYSAQVIKTVGNLTDDELTAGTIMWTKKYHLKAKHKMSEEFFKIADQAVDLLEANPKFQRLEPPTPIQ